MSSIAPKQHLREAVAELDVADEGRVSLQAVGLLWRLCWRLGRLPRAFAHCSSDPFCSLESKCCWKISSRDSSRSPVSSLLRAGLSRDHLYVYAAGDLLLYQSCINRGHRVPDTRPMHSSWPPWTVTSASTMLTNSSFRRTYVHTCGTAAAWLFLMAVLGALDTDVVLSGQELLAAIADLLEPPPDGGEEPDPAVELKSISDNHDLRVGERASKRRRSAGCPSFTVHVWYTVMPAQV